ncbi:hypothetical protein SAMN05216238_10364 [Lentibacillus persicus]|uniref:Uncharacterized protein n=1 Tax=Lentibacillus persicus TaxID=640948 RepID=A0A1I1U7A5_9BACI|nr:paeninodin family lasso peptide [Lentibacillus persicus]SFD66712.1 hypothetical protein SAMN05216238_10364 [Lentibacillus persicus]
MKQEWKAPKLELLEVRETMAKWRGDSFDGFFIGREYADEGPGPGEEPPAGS